MRTLVVIPARFSSTRFPGKPLALIQGTSMIQRVYQQAKKARRADQIVIATDDSRIRDHVEGFGGLVRMTSHHHPSGTDRCAEVAEAFPDFDLIINIQGDEPFIQPEIIDLLIEYLALNPEIPIATLVKKIEDTDTLFNPGVVKVVFDEQHKALYFSRCPIPYRRDVQANQWLTDFSFYKHIGIYGFRRNTLLEITQLAPSRLEKAEMLEQLRWLSHGYPVFVQETNFDSHGIDTPRDLEKWQNLHTSRPV